MPYYIGDVIKDYKKLVMRTPEEFGKTGVDVKIKTSVEAINPDQGSVHLSDGSVLPYDILVMATGADAIRLDMPGADLEGVFVLRDLTHALRLKSYLNEKSCRKAVIVGAGYIGMEMCEAFRSLGIETPGPRYSAPSRASLGSRIREAHGGGTRPESGGLSSGHQTPCHREGQGLRAQADYGQR